MYDYTFPKICKPILEAIRKEVPIPKELPEPVRQDPHIPLLRWGKSCPMGLLPISLCEAPASDRWFIELPKGFTNDAIREFAITWDSFTDPVKAVESVWGKNEQIKQRT